MTCCHHDDVLEWLWWCSDDVDILSLMALLNKLEISAVDVAVVAALVSSTVAAAVAEVNVEQ